MAKTEHKLIPLVISCLDLTSLHDTDTEDHIITLCSRAITEQGSVAAVCIKAIFVKLAKKILLDKNIRIATVANFPTGETDIGSVIEQIEQSLSHGADEIDLVFPYQTYLSGDKTTALELIHKARETCATATLKVILETGALKTPEIIGAASRDCLHAGADFLKTSTGKIPVGATIEAATIMLQTIRLYQTNHPRKVGFKASGGVRTTTDAMTYLLLAKKIMGAEWICPSNFRIGASSLLTELLQS